MKLECDPERPGDLYLNGALFASIHPGQAGLSDEPMAQLWRLAAEVARRWNMQAAEAEEDLADADLKRRNAKCGRSLESLHSDTLR